MASLPILILRYSLLILVFFSFISSSLARPFWIFIYFLFFRPLALFRDGGMAGAARRARHGHWLRYDEAYELRYLVTLDSSARSKGCLFFLPPCLYLLVFTRCFGLAFAADWMSLQKFGG